MSYDEISYTLRTLGISNEGTSQPNVKDKQHPLSREKIQRYFAQHKSAFETHQEESQSQAPSNTSGRNSRQSSQHNFRNSRESSSLSRYDGSLDDKNKRKIKGGCPNCRNGSRRPSDENEYGSNPQQRIRYLQQRIKSLESQIGQSKKQFNPNIYTNDQYFMKIQPQNYPRNGQNHSQQQQFTAMCIDMVAKLAKIEQPSLKYCWKFLKANITSSIKQEGMMVEFPVSPVKRKVDFVLHQTKEVLGVRKNESIPQAVRKMKEENDVLRKVYEKILKLFQLKVTHPYMLAYYLEDYTDKLNRYESEESQSTDK